MKLTDAERSNLEAKVLEAYLPGLTKSQRKAVKRLVKEKRVRLYDRRLHASLTNILASVVRHRDTDYESMCAAVGRDRARFYVQPIIAKSLKEAACQTTPA